MEGRKYFIDCARAMCMLYIVGFWHLIPYIDKGIQSLLTRKITYGVLAVFTFISGYLLGSKKVQDHKDCLIFYIRRLLTFYPLFVIAAALMWYIGYIKNFREWLFTVLGLSGIISPAAVTLWYLCMLMLFYLVTPLVNFCHKVPVKIILILTIMTVLLLFTHITGLDERYWFYWCFYGAGILMSGRISAQANLYLLVLSPIVFAIISLNIGDAPLKYHFIPCICVLVFALNLGGVLAKNVLFAILAKNKLCKHVRISFS
ncbi:MAG: acyltransferase family protein [Lachnospiraceae bacterium]|nr:acyltransferase family protein [Lachnospiraceae bacterium]